MATIGMIIGLIAIMMSSFLMGCYLTDRGFPVRNMKNEPNMDADEALRKYKDSADEVVRTYKEIMKELTEDDEDEEEEA